MNCVFCKSLMESGMVSDPDTGRTRRLMRCSSCGIEIRSSRNLSTAELSYLLARVV